MDGGAFHDAGFQAVQKDSQACFAATESAQHYK